MRGPLGTLLIYIDEIHRLGGRAWAYVQSVGAEEADLEDPKNGIYKLIDKGGQWYWHVGRFPTYMANAQWARRIIPIWAPRIREMGFDGIHWDTLGAIAADYQKESSGMHSFLRTAHELMKPYQLSQTFNFVDLAWWKEDVVRNVLEFPYAEVWSQGMVERYLGIMTGLPLNIWGVIAHYPSVTMPMGWTQSEVLQFRWKHYPLWHLVYLVVGDGGQRLIDEYFPKNIPLSDAEANFLTWHKPNP